MATTLITNIGELFTSDPDGPLTIEDAALVVEGDRVAWTGPASSAPDADDHCAEAHLHEPVEEVGAA